VYLLKRLKMAMIAVLAVAMVAATAGTASADQPNEDKSFTRQSMPGSPSGWTSRDVPSAAVSTVGSNLRFWLSDDNTGRMWLSYNGGNPYQIDGNSFAAPVVVPWGAGGFAIFHTGIDNRIYYRFSATGQPGSWGSGWVPVTDFTGVQQTTPFTVSVASLGSNHLGQMYMVFRSNDQRRSILGMFFDGRSWLRSVDLGGVTDFAPAVTYNPVSDRIFVVHTGTTRQVYYSSSGFGSNPPGSWFSLGGRLDGRPSIASMANGNMQVGGIAAGAPWYMELNAGGGQIIPNWVRDSSNTASLTLAALTLLGVGNSILVYIRNPGDFVYLKTAWRL
jgi:hypothetical protein